MNDLGSERELLSQRTVRSLRGLAGELGIRGRWRMRKAELVAAIAEALRGAGAPAAGSAGPLPQRASGDGELSGTAGRPPGAGATGSGGLAALAPGKPPASAPAAAPRPGASPPSSTASPRLTTFPLAGRGEAGGPVPADSPPSPGSPEPRAEDLYIDRGPPLPSRYPGARFRAMIRDARTLYLYWQFPEALQEPLEVVAEGPGGEVLALVQVEAERSGLYLALPVHRLRRLRLLQPGREGEDARLLAGIELPAPEESPGPPEWRELVGGPPRPLLPRRAAPRLPRPLPDSPLREARGGWPSLPEPGATPLPPLAHSGPPR